MIRRIKRRKIFQGALGINHGIYQRKSRKNARVFEREGHDAMLETMEILLRRHLESSGDERNEMAYAVALRKIAVYVKQRIDAEKGRKR